MTPGPIQQRVVAERVAWVREMLAGIRSLPLGSWEEFSADARNVASAESYLRRSLEALLDLGRHIAARGFARPVEEYRQIAVALREVGVLGEGDADRLGRLAGYRNRMVHFYDEISREELYEICTVKLADVEKSLESMLAWLNQNPERMD